MNQRTVACIYVVDNLDFIFSANMLQCGLEEKAAFLFASSQQNCTWDWNAIFKYASDGFQKDEAMFGLTSIKINCDLLRGYCNILNCRSFAVVQQSTSNTMYHLFFLCLVYSFQSGQMFSSFPSKI